MGMDSSSQAHHQLQVHQELASDQTLESMLVCSKPLQEKKPRPAEQALKCPRCDSNNTKFCYYNNYSLSQPRYFCKSCRRYWTKGGTLRNVPVGGGCRRNKRSSSSSSSSSSASSKRSGQDQPLIPIPNSIIPCLANVSYDSNDLSLAFARLQKQGQMGTLDDYDFLNMGNHPNIPYNDHVLGFDAVRGEFLENPFGFTHNLYNGNLGIEMGMGFEEINSGSTAVTATVKQEICSSKEAGENKVLWGFPWQNIGGGDVNTSWNNAIGSTNWHGLLNTPLM